MMFRCLTGDREDIHIYGACQFLEGNHKKSQMQRLFYAQRAKVVNTLCLLLGGKLKFQREG